MSILVAMSGGVDSSVSAFLCAREHSDCRGATMLLWGDDLTSSEDARNVCKILGLEHEVLDLRGMFAECVIKKFVKVYESGGTPNPCVDCNKSMKFGAFLEHAKSLGLEKIATGHYARIEQTSSGRYLLRKAADISRDQSYVLYGLTQEQLSRTEFPLGEMTKREVRDLAEAQGFTNARKSDSQDICFVPDGDYGGFIESFTGKVYPSGKFVDTSGQVLGTHRGIIHYTAGQRKGLGVAAKSRLYVAGVDVSANTITLATEGEAELYARGVIVRDVNMIAFDEVPANLRANVRTRYRQREVLCVVNQSGSDELVIEFGESQRVPAVGQAAVLYDGEYVLGGGTIIATL